MHKHNTAGVAASDIAKKEKKMVKTAWSDFTAKDLTTFLRQSGKDDVKKKKDDIIAQCVAFFGNDPSALISEEGKLVAVRTPTRTYSASERQAPPTGRSRPATPRRSPSRGPPTTPRSKSRPKTKAKPKPRSSSRRRAEEDATQKQTGEPAPPKSPRDPSPKPKPRWPVNKGPISNLTKSKTPAWNLWGVNNLFSVAALVVVGAVLYAFYLWGPDHFGHRTVFCNVGEDPPEVAPDFNDENAREKVTCVRCPEHGLCSEGDLKGCDEAYEIVKGPDGHMHCEKSRKGQKLAYGLLDKMAVVLKDRRGRALCRGSGEGEVDHEAETGAMSLEEIESWAEGESESKAGVVKIFMDDLVRSEDELAERGLEKVGEWVMSTESAAQQPFECRDLLRGRHDKETNLRSTRRFCFREGKWIATTWQDVKLGDIVLILKNESFPADLVLVCSSHREGLCFVDTANLDGETNLKSKRAPAELHLHFLRGRYRLLEGRNQSQKDGERGQRQIAAHPLVDSDKESALLACSHGDGESGRGRFTETKVTQEERRIEGVDGQSSEDEDENEDEQDGEEAEEEENPHNVKLLEGLLCTDVHLKVEAPHPHVGRFLGTYSIQGKACERSSTPSTRSDSNCLCGTIPCPFPLALQTFSGSTARGHPGLFSSRRLSPSPSQSLQTTTQADGEKQKEKGREREAVVGDSLSYLGEEFPLSPASLLYRGCVLRNSSWVVGMVIYAGDETKIQMNSAAAPTKISQAQRTMNRLLRRVFYSLFAVCLAFSLVSYILDYQMNSPERAWYLWANGSSPGDAGFGIVTGFFTFLVAYAHLIPLSLYIALEVLKVTLTSFITSDSFLVQEETGVATRARTSDLVEELGQVSFVFSDKTGTLTSNSMELLKVCVNGKAYGPSPAEADDARTEGRQSEGICGDRSALEAVRDGQNPDSRSLLRLFTAMAVCHSVVPDRKSASFRRASARAQRKFLRSDTRRLLDPSETAYEGNGPSSRGAECQLDEAAGNRGERRTEGRGSARYPPLSTPFPFSSSSPTPQTTNSIFEGTEERRGSVRESGISLASLPPLQYQGPSPDEVALVDAAARQEVQFLGAKTTKGKRVLSIRVFNQVLKFTLLHEIPFTADRKRMTVVVEHHGAVWSMTKGADSVMAPLLLKGEHWHTQQHEIMWGKREKRGEEGAKKERERDKGIDDATAKQMDEFSRMGLRTLVFGCRKLEENEYTSWRLQWQRAELCNDLASREAQMESCASVLEDNLELLGVTAVEDRLQEEVPETIAALREMGLHIWVLTDSPQQHRHITSSSAASSVSGRGAPPESRQALALAIDGETVGHAMEADEEGRRFFVELCLRASVCICCRLAPAQKAELVRMVREELQVVTLAIGDGANDVSMIQSLFSEFSGQIFFPNWLTTCFNFAWTSWPCLFNFVLDLDVSAYAALKRPQLYGAGPANAFLNSRTFNLWVCLGLWHGVIAFFIPLFGMWGSSDSSGQVKDYWLPSFVSFSSLVLIVALKLALETSSWRAIQIVVLVASLAFYFCCALILNTWLFAIAFQWNLRGIVELALVSKLPLLLMVTVPVVALVCLNVIEFF
uniref:P-type phospholipid transporter n=1 Tax=Chromera velia CCMP2878 TaxID=1169474 RepID=A0A0G4GGX4_9ALVE|eukprot:Cvel_4689.t1-p1 / transcript=Cvel_4689.t1 / gene=Cvel_4689 / organism=Chromera_velia_CCMP2878 / gene_product=Phospholipid-transporting ATPase 1, putative / transcript_product=Phospholipid-transporting ATPase 1, putative / location=Cvel_scaffold208:37755-62758(+) / protein_length=1582 / sequence_SO=supercontig / SO=protein_coding / is_pseudo=false